MELASEYFGLTGELMEFLAKGDGTYSVYESETKSKLISVTVKMARDKTGDVVAEQMDDEPVQFFADIEFVMSDESRGAVQVCFSPVTFLLLDYKPVVLKEGDVIEDKIKEIIEGVKNDGNLTNDNMSVWSKSLVSYVSKGQGTHAPNFVDTMLGMTQVTVKWGQRPVDEGTLLQEFGDGTFLMYQCQIAYMTEPKGSGSVIFQVMPYDIRFSS